MHNIKDILAFLQDSYSNKAATVTFETLGNNNGIIFFKERFNTILSIHYIHNRRYCSFSVYDKDVEPLFGKRNSELSIDDLFLSDSAAIEKFINNTLNALNSNRFKKRLAV